MKRWWLNNYAHTRFIDDQIAIKFSFKALAISRMPNSSQHNMYCPDFDCHAICWPLSTKPSNIHERIQITQKQHRTFRHWNQNALVLQLCPHKDIHDHSYMEILLSQNLYWRLVIYTKSYHLVLFQLCYTFPHLSKIYLIR